jgi:hypothetical protein
MTTDQLIAHYGTQAKAAKALGLTWAAVYVWRRRDAIPYLRQLQIQEITGGALKADAPVVVAA